MPATDDLYANVIIAQVLYTYFGRKWYEKLRIFLRNFDAQIGGKIGKLRNFEAENTDFLRNLELQFKFLVSYIK